MLLFSLMVMELVFYCKHEKKIISGITWMNSFTCSAAIQCAASLLNLAREELVSALLHAKIFDTAPFFSCFFCGLAPARNISFIIPFLFINYLHVLRT